MPKYDYRCTSCGKVYEKRESFSAPVLQECPACRGAARRMFSPPALVFKGSGWYKTDSRGPAPSESAAVSSTETKTETAAMKTEPKTEPKVETKAESKPATTTADAAAAD